MSVEKEKRQKILIAEDEQPMAKAMKLKLEKAGFEASVALNGEDALRAAEREHFDLIITDILMPRMDGFEILEALKEREIATPVIVTSNLSQEEDRKKVLELGARDYFVKSNTPILQIVEHVKKVLGRRPGEAQLLTGEAGSPEK